MDDFLRFWGVRGSLPTPGPATAGVGGNTSCVEVNLGGELLIIDGGSGLRALGAHLGGRPIQATMLFSHLHWDHIQGIPFFSPLYHPASRVTLIGPQGLEAALSAQMSTPTFPIGMEAFGAELRFRVVEAGERLSIGPVAIRTAALAHPGGALGYRLEAREASLAYLCDHEQGEGAPAEELVSFVAGVEALVHDAQYLPEELPGKAGWGHSTYAQAAALARRARVCQLLLTHHDPLRSDLDVAQLERRAQQLFPAARAAREELVVRTQRGCPAPEELFQAARSAA